MDNQVKPGDMVEVDRCVFAASTQVDGQRRVCRVRDVNEIGQIYVQPETGTGLYTYPKYVHPLRGSKP